MEIKYCKCGSPMSAYEVERFGRCGGCQENIRNEELLAEIKEDEERKEQERLKKLKEEEEKMARLQAQKDYFNEKLKSLEGKVITSAVVTEWTDAMGIQPKEIQVTFDDGTSAYFTQEEVSDGCMGHYDYYQYLGISII